MQNKSFNILINAPRKKVWQILWGEDTYPKWTGAFMEGSRVEDVSGDILWKKGNKIRFLGPGNEGMISLINENVPEEFMSFKHLGVVVNGKDDVESEQAKEWKGSMENYSLKAIGGKTELTVNIDISPSFVEYFVSAWPNALQRIKELSEQ